MVMGFMELNEVVVGVWSVFEERNLCRESTAGQIVSLAQSWSNKEEADCGAKGLKLRNPGEIGLAQGSLLFAAGITGSD